MAGEDKQDGEIKNGTQKAKVASVGDSDQGDLGYSNEGLASAVGDQNHGSLGVPFRSPDKVAQESGQAGKVEAAVKIAEPQPVEKPSADEVRKPVPHLRIVPSAEVRKTPATSGLPQVADTLPQVVKPLESTSALLTQKVRTEWRAEWRTVSRNRRPLIKRLYIWECGKRRKATREDVESGLISGAEPLVQNLHTFTAAATAKIESEGKLDAVRNHAQRILDATNTKRARTA